MNTWRWNLFTFNQEQIQTPITLGSLQGQNGWSTNGMVQVPSLTQWGVSYSHPPPPGQWGAGYSQKPTIEHGVASHTQQQPTSQGSHHFIQGQHWETGFSRPNLKLNYDL